MTRARARKSPIRHKVHKHTRAGNPVQEYMRGTGRPSPHRSRVVKGLMKNYRLTIYYPNETREIEVKAEDHLEALEKAPRLSEAREVHGRVI